jgi:ketosteroid isomerase-like protein
MSKWMPEHSQARHQSRHDARWHDIINKSTGNPMNREEVGLYSVRNGKIVRKEFFYDTGL